ncbi:MAG: choice-of-anchor D domain-containing protein [Acidobacteriota bacterium]|nr:choice-of-anchor D domain-containing protein [Acidobacteriota bacterium]
MSNEPLIDLPLPGEPGRSQNTPPAPAAPKGPPPKARRGLWVAVLVAAAAAAGYFAPKPGPPVVTSDLNVVDVPEQRIGEPGPEWPIEIRNGGQRPLEILSVTLDGGHAEAFSLSADGCTQARLEAQQGCRALVLFEPEALGPHEIDLVVASNAPNSPFRLPIRGQAVQPELVATPTSLDFPALLAGEASERRQIRLRNSGTSALSLGKLFVPGNEFFKRDDGCSQSELPPGAECELTIEFAPKKAGTRRQALSVPSDAPGAPHDISLVGEATSPVPTLVVSEEALDFGTRRADAGTQTDRLTLRNAGTGTLRITSIQMSDSNAFAFEPGQCEGARLAQNDECHVGISFLASEEGSFSARVRLSSNASHGAIDVDLTGATVLPRLVVAPTSLDFGLVAVTGDRALGSLRIHNDGTAPLGIRRADIIAGGSSAFEVANDRCSRVVLEPGEECRIEIGFRTTEEGLHQARLAIREREGDAVTSVSLRGESVRGRLELSARALDLGDVEVGESVRGRLTLTNAGRTALAIREVRLDGSRDFRISVDGCRTMRALAPDAFCTVVLEHAPAAAGIAQTSLSIRHDGRDGTASVRVSSRATLPAVARIEINPGAIEFGTADPGARSEIHTVTILNDGDGRLQLGAIQIGGPWPNDFQIVPATCAGLDHLAPGGSCTVGIRFTPNEPAGPRSGELVVTHGASNEPATVGLSGEARIVPAAEETTPP